MNTPQEIVVWFIIPALRRQFVIELKKHKLKQKEIASLLNLTEAAVSQYLKKKRGEKITFDAEIKKEVKKSAEKIVNKKSNFRKELQIILRKLEQTRFVCSVGHKYMGVPEDCNICY